MRLLLKNWRICFVSALWAILLGVVVCSPVPSVEEQAPKEVSEPTPKPPRSGHTIYAVYCSTCHGLDGTGQKGQWAADFVNDKERMAKSDEELLNSIREGMQGEIGIMPRWKNRLTEEEIVGVLKHIRKTFSDPQK